MNMKKKFSMLLLSILILPLVALFGCDESVSYTVNVYSSSTIYGSVSGKGSYSEGSTVTLTATALKGSHFIAWVRQNTILTSGGTYSISNTEDDSGEISKSTLTFSSSSSTQGEYYAVFAENNIVYVKLDSFFISTTADSDGEEDSESQAEIMTASSINISQGSTSLSTIYSTSNVSIKDGVLVTTENISSVLKLSPSTTQNVRAVCVFIYGTSVQSFTFNGGLLFQEDISSDDYTVTYSNGTYKITFEFLIGDETFYLNLIYKTLS